MTRRAALVPLLLCLAVPAWAQRPSTFEGRWRVLLHPPGAAQETVRGELDIGSAGASRTLRLETDSAPMPFALDAAHQPAADSLVVRRDDPDGLELRGRWNGFAWVGTARDRLGPRGTFEADLLQDDAEYYAALPRFGLRQLLLGPRGEPVEVPAAWWGAAQALGASDPAATWQARHAEAAQVAGVVPADSATAQRWLRGLEDRVHLREAMVQALLRLRRGATDTAGRAAFDALFRREERWVVDLHDAAAEWVRVRQPGWTWEVTRASLVAAGLLPAGATEADVLDELANLWAMGRRDPAALEARTSAIALASPADSTLPAVVAGYTEAVQWHVQAVRYLAVRLAPAALDLDRLDLVPEPRPAGEVQATLALRGPLIDACMSQENIEASRWLERHGQAGMAAMFGRLQPDYGQAASIEVGGRTLMLSTPAREAERDASGLADRTLVAYDPTEPPLIAVSRVMEGAAQIVFLRGWRSTGGLVAQGGTCYLPDAEPHLLSGFGAVLEGHAAGAAGLPVLAAGAALRRAVAARAAPRSPAVLGPFLVEAHARQVRPGDAGALLNALLGLGYDWPRAAPLWPAAPNSAPAHRLIPSRGPVLVPALDFFIESGLPTATGMRVLPLSPPR